MSAATHPPDAGRLQDVRTLPFVDVLRGIAILMVIFAHHGIVFHADATQYGRTGVQLFFVASAFSLSLSADVRRRERHPTLSFYVRRLLRIAPLYYVGIAIYATLWSVSHGHDGVHAPNFRYSAAAILTNMLFLHGLVPAYNNQVVPGGWSIATEMLFYLLFPALDRLIRSSRRRYGLWGPAATVVLALAVDAALLPVIAHAAGLELASDSFLYFSLLNQLPVFLIGMFAYHLVTSGHFALPGSRITAPAFVLASGMALAVLRWQSPAAVVLLPTMAGVSFLLLLLCSRAVLQREGVLGRIGRVSYSMYVFHFLLAWPLTKFVRAGLGAYVTPPLLYVATLVLTIAGTYALALAGRRLVEDPFIALGKRLADLGPREIVADKPRPTL